MVRLSRLALFSLLFIVFAIDTLHAAPYYGYDELGHHWYDVEKSSSNLDDDQLCWAATASNMLAYTGWGFPENSSLTSANDIFSYFQDHWTNAAGNMYYGVRWWFDGSDSSSSSPSQVDGGGSFYSPQAFASAYTFETEHSWGSAVGAMDTINQYLHNGYGVGLSIVITNSQGSVIQGHAVTAWGYEFDDDGNYSGIYVTDSDDYNNTENHDLRLYNVFYDNDNWYLDNYFGTDEWHIVEVHGLAQMSTNAVPIPSSALLFCSGCLVLGFRNLRSRKKQPLH